MTEIIGVRFKSGGKQYYFDPRGLEVKSGQGVIVEAGKGMEYGICCRPNGFVNDDAVVQPLRGVVRLATEADERAVADNVIRERQAMRIAQEKIARHGLEMKLVRVEYAFDGSKIIFFFTAEGRVDFRALVKDLAGVFHARIELRQIGVRDEARMLGGLGVCGKPFCCSQFLEEFQPVSIKMAKTQSLSLNPTKISGTCGRLMCCLKYEQDAYEDAVKRCPKNESFVECPDGVGDVVSVNLLREQVRVKLDDSTDLPKTYRVSEVRVVRAGKGRRPEDYTPPPKAELEKLRFIPEGEKEKPRRGQDRLSAALESIFSHEIEPAAPARERRGGERRRQGNRDKQAAPRPPKDRQAGPGPKPARSQPEKKPAEKKPPQEAKPARMDAPRPAGGGNGRSRRHYRSYKPKRQE